MGSEWDERSSRLPTNRISNRKLLVVLLLFFVLIASLALASGALSRSEPFELAPAPFLPTPDA